MRVRAKRWEALPGVTAWLASLADVAPADWEPLYRQMDPARQARCARYAHPADAKRCILADALARSALAALSGQPEEHLHFQSHPGGKPYAVDLPLEFSLSHSGELVLCAAASFPVGADLQRLRPLSPSLVDRIVQAGCQGRSEEELFRWWVRQEAIGKLTGQGLRLAPLPAPDACRTDTLKGPDGQYWYCVCAQAPQNT